MRLHDLSGIAVADLAAVFNAAFADYFLPVQFTDQQFADKMHLENIIPEYSAGASVDGRLVAFILMGVGTDGQRSFSYNAGTGVIPEFRGQQLTLKMYGFLLPVLEQANIRRHTLEVLTRNTKAIPVYEAVGYSIARTVSCFRGKVFPPLVKFPLTFTPFDFEEDSLVQPFWNHTPAYQNQLSVIYRNKDAHETWGVFENGVLIAYIIYAKNSLRIKQFGVHPGYRHQSVGHQLFYKVQCTHPEMEVSLINIDNNDTATHQFLKQIGLVVFTEQFEMVFES